MLKIKKFSANIYPGYYGTLHNPEYTHEGEDLPDEYVFKHSFSSSGSVLNYKLISTIDNKTVFDFNIDINDIKSLPSFDEETLWAINDTFVNEHKYEEEVTVPSTSYNNVFAQTVAGKTSIQAAEFGLGLFPIKLFIPTNTSSVEDIYVLLAEPMADGMVVIPFVSEIEGTVEISTIPNLSEDRSILVSQITITPSASSPAAGDDIIINIQTSDTSIKYVYVQPIVGIVNKTKVKLTNGAGTVTIKTDTLDSGDEVDVKFGYRYFTNVARYTKTLG